MEELIAILVGAVNARTLYPAEHPRVLEAMSAFLATLSEICQTLARDSVTILVIGDDLVADEQIIRRTTLLQRQFVEMLKRHQIERLTLADGLGFNEAHDFITALAEGVTPESSSHIVLGRVKVATDGADEAKLETEEYPKDEFDAVRAAFAKFRIDRKMPLAPMEQLVWGFIDTLSRSTRAMLPLAKLKEHDEYTFVHAVNVSLLVLAQARAFGIQGPMLHAFGMAALLHDIGKLMVPLNVLNFPGKLEGEEWAIMKSHAEQGAWYLSETEGASPLSIVVAYEHHLRYDGKPNYPTVREGRRPNLCSRMTSIADTYDAIATVRPYQKARMRSTAMEILTERAETFYDPMLLANFKMIVAATEA